MIAMSARCRVMRFSLIGFHFAEVAVVSQARQQVL
jgi:hypothetical protein